MRDGAPTIHEKESEKVVNDNFAPCLSISHSHHRRYQHRADTAPRNIAEVYWIGAGVSCRALTTSELSDP